MSHFVPHPQIIIFTLFCPVQTFFILIYDLSFACTHFEFFMFFYVISLFFPSHPLP